ncbi:hypothetical protein, partial [Oleiphilus sp. HI0066]|uniref:hypothetical protein n=1 Tax=Oleiphilus sp. HI0066 TaxID=1822242 RepID=UPI001E35E138
FANGEINKSAKRSVLILFINSSFINYHHIMPQTGAVLERRSRRKAVQLVTWRLSQAMDAAIYVIFIQQSIEFSLSHSDT